MASTPQLSFLLFLILLLLFSPNAGNPTAHSQCSILLNFKQSFTNSSSKLDTWHHNTNCCYWDGITCEPFLGGAVTGLDLSGCLITGKIGPSLFNLTSLHTLNLAYNLFDPSPIPNGFELLSRLTSLNLSTAGFRGQIPIGLAKLTNLVSLDLSTYDEDGFPSNYLELKNPDFETLIGNMSNLRELYLDGVNISSARGFQWSTAVVKWTPKLRALSLAQCSITGPIHSSFIGLHNLSIIRLNDNELNCSVPEFFGNLSSLKEITLSSCGLNGVFPKSVFLLRNLKVVDLSDNQMLSTSLPDFPGESKLEMLILSHTNFSGSSLISMGKLQYLTRMELSDCHLSGAIPSSISNLTRLAFLDLSDNHFSGAIPSYIRNLRHLKALDLDSNLLSGQIPSLLSGQFQEFSNGYSSQLVFVDLSNNLLQGRIPRSVFRLLSLKYLNLAYNNISDTVELDQFSTLRNLLYLDLSYNNISIPNRYTNDSFVFPKLSSLALASCNLKNIPTFLRYQNQVSDLDLSNNKIIGEVPNWIWSVFDNSLKFFRLGYLNLSFNNFSSLEGPLPNLSKRSVVVIDLHSNSLKGPILLPPINIKILDYSNNQLSSSIPSNINSYLSFTIFFSLANNSLIGEIPSSICNSSYLEIIDLSNNKLSGLIPLCLLEGNNSLKVLNLGGNKLQGTIPQNISQGCGLQTLNLNDNHLEGRLPQSLANCNVLEFLDLGNNHISDPFPLWLGDIHSLRVLILRSNELYGHVAPPPRIYSNNYFFPMLQIIDISSNYFNGRLPLELFKNLKAMMVNSVLNRTSIGFEYVGNNPCYYQDSVTVTSKRFQMKLVKTMKIFTSIDLSNNSFEGNIPAIIGELKSLIVLNISHNALTGNIPPSIGNLLQIESLDLSKNNLSGNIPQELSNLTFLSSLNLSYNKLVGLIPHGNQFSTFSDTSYEGNEGLCGIPLTKKCNDATPTIITGRKPLLLKSNHSPSTYVIGLALFIGLGCGVGNAIVFVLQNISCKFWKRQDHVDRS